MAPLIFDKSKSKKWLVKRALRIAPGLTVSVCSMASLLSASSNYILVKPPRLSTKFMEWRCFCCHVVDECHHIRVFCEKSIAALVMLVSWNESFRTREMTGSSITCTPFLVGHRKKKQAKRCLFGFWQVRSILVLSCRESSPLLGVFFFFFWDLAPRSCRVAVDVVVKRLDTMFHSTYLMKYGKSCCLLLKGV